MTMYKVYPQNLKYYMQNYLNLIFWLLPKLGLAQRIIQMICYFSHTIDLNVKTELVIVMVVLFYTLKKEYVIIVGKIGNKGY